MLLLFFLNHTVNCYPPRDALWWSQSAVKSSSVTDLLSDYKYCHQSVARTALLLPCALSGRLNERETKARLPYWAPSFSHNALCYQAQPSPNSMRALQLPPPWWKQIEQAGANMKYRCESLMGKIANFQSCGGQGKKNNAACARQLHYSLMQIRMDKEDIRREILYGGSTVAQTVPRVVRSSLWLAQRFHQRNETTANWQHPAWWNRHHLLACEQADSSARLTDWLTDCCVPFSPASLWYTLPSQSGPIESERRLRPRKFHSPPFDWQLCSHLCGQSITETFPTATLFLFFTMHVGELIFMTPHWCDSSTVCMKKYALGLLVLFKMTGMGLTACKILLSKKHK